MKKLFGETRLRDLPQNVLIPAFDLDNEEKAGERIWKPKFFHNFKGQDSDGEILARKVALYTSAAPTFFPSIEGFVDGGVVCNNPSVAALAQALDRRSSGPRPTLGEITLLSVGTGKSLWRITGKKKDWGYAQWGKPLIRIMLEGVMDVADFQCRQLLRERYCRIGPVFPAGKTVQLDDVEKIPYLKSFAESFDIGDTLTWLRRNWK
jgi:hypothetical protein